MSASSSNRVSKSTKPKGSGRQELSSAAIASIENELSTINPSVIENRTDKKLPQGIVIDGKTYTCASCKSGHRVGVCKHARERPMKPTHPPGRPAAGATKKIVCDCPKECKCAKKDCKCPRQCACVQSMYMLVYIPGPGEDGNENPMPEEEKGTWKIGKEVTTDLKGNILSEEQIRKRREQKENQKDGLKTSNLNSIPKESPKATILNNDTRSRSSSIQEPKSPSEARPKVTGGCCRHKQVLQDQLKKAAEPSRQPPPIISTTPARCNCGIACRCAFCPEHSNNATSHDAVRRQFNLYQQTNHFPITHLPIDTMITPFNTGIAPDMSCMGGQPRFALTCYPVQPNFASFGQAFPTGGGSGAYVIAYPMHPRFAPSTPMIEAQPTQVFSQETDITAPLQAEPSASATQMPAPISDLLNFADYDIGEALVANDGPNGWQESEWPNQGLATPDMFPDYNDHNFPLVNDVAFTNLETLANWEGSPLGHNNFSFSPNENHFPNRGGMMTPRSSRTPSHDRGQGTYVEQLTGTAMQSTTG